MEPRPCLQWSPETTIRFCPEADESILFPQPQCSIWSISVLSLGNLFPSHFQMHFVHISYPMTDFYMLYPFPWFEQLNISWKIWIMKLLMQLFTFSSHVLHLQLDIPCSICCAFWEWEIRFYAHTKQVRKYMHNIIVLACLLFIFTISYHHQIVCVSDKEIRCVR